MIFKYLQRKNWWPECKKFMVWFQIIKTVLESWISGNKIIVVVFFGFTIFHGEIIVRILKLPSKPRNCRAQYKLPSKTPGSTAKHVSWADMGSPWIKFHEMIEKEHIPENATSFFVVLRAMAVILPPWSIFSIKEHFIRSEVVSL